MKEVEELYEGVNTFSEYRKQLELNRPFHFNIVDSIKTRENDHSRILGTILKKNDSGNFTLLKSYLDYFGIKEEIKNPEINIEKGYIDVSIIDEKGKYAIIIENKIFGAVDQSNQINNYYEQIRSRYKNINIYVQYLTKFGKKEPTEDSLSKDIKEKLEDNFSIISYSEDILNWLSEVLPDCKIKNKEFIYSLKLYIDFIRGITNNRISKKMEKQLQGKIDEILNVGNKTIGEKASKYNETIEKLKEFQTTIEKLNKPITDEIRGEFLKKLFNKLKENGEWECVTFVNKPSNIDNYNENNFGFKNLDCEYNRANALKRYNNFNLFFSLFYCKSMNYLLFLLF